MSKDVLINAVKEKMDAAKKETEKLMSKKDAEKILDVVMECISEAIVAEDTFKIINFGTFKKTHKEAHTGRNPQTGDPVAVPAKNVVRFSPAKALKAIINPA